MAELLIIFIIQAVFIFMLDHKVRMLHGNDVQQLVLFQTMIGTMYVIVIPLLAVGGIAAGIAYVLGSVTGTIVSHYSYDHTKGKE